MAVPATETLTNVDSSGMSAETQCEMQETVRMLDLAVAHINMSMTEGDESVQTLSDAFTKLAAGVQTANPQVQELLARKDSDENVEHVLQHWMEMSQSIQEAVVAFQFYDRLSQRLTHVRDSLSALAELVGDKQLVKLIPAPPLPKSTAHPSLK